MMTLENKKRINFEVLKQAANIQDSLKKNNIEVRLLGGTAVYYKCPEYHDYIHTHRETFSDIDFVTLRKNVRDFERVLEGLGFSENQNIKMLFGNQRRAFHSKNNLTVELYIDSLLLCQDIIIGDRLFLDNLTISWTDLFLSKIQNVKLKEKDIFDLIILLQTIGKYDTQRQEIDMSYIAKLCATHWGWWKTIKTNIALLRNKQLIEHDQKPYFLEVIGELENVIDNQSYSFRWKTRNLIGTKFKWHNLVDDTA